MKILNFGSMNLDTVYHVPHFVLPGETLSAESVSTHPGGKGLNQSIALARAGAPVFHAGCLGRGGDVLADLLRTNGVDTRYLIPCPDLQGSAMIQVTPDGENSIILYGGSNQCLTESQIQDTLKDFGKDDWLLLQNEVNLLPVLIREASARGMRIVLNPSPFNEKILSLDLHSVSWLLINEVEASQLTGSSDPSEAWTFLHVRYPALSLVLTLGAEGSLVFCGDRMQHQAAFPVKAVDSTGAGDTYTGYFLTALIEGRPLSACMKIASCAAALSVSRPGAADSIPYRQEVEQALTAVE